MDRSKLRAFVARQIRPLMRRLGLPHWTITVHYDLRRSDDDTVTNAECTRLADYNKAAINFDPEQFDEDEPERTLSVLRHELFHVVLSPFDLYQRAAETLCENDSVKLALLRSTWTHSVEQGVVNLERMYQGLTAQK